MRTLRNQFWGINPHLNSLLQNEGNRTEFHTRHMIHLADALKTQLLPLGYTTAIESSIQVRRVDIFSPPQQFYSDVAIYDLNPPPISEKKYVAIQIKHQRGEPVAWIELLSPSNKRQDREAYRDKRLKLAEAGLIFIELDYLHHTPPTLEQLPHLQHPYRIIIIDPRPDLESGKVRVREFDVDNPLPTLDIPLSGDDHIVFNFDVPYQRTFEEALYGIEWVDYRKLPLHFESYTLADQYRLIRRMLTVLEASETENPPLPLITLESLEAGLAHLKHLSTP